MKGLWPLRGLDRTVFGAVAAFIGIYVLGVVNFGEKISTFFRTFSPAYAPQITWVPLDPTALGITNGVAVIMFAVGLYLLLTRR